MVGFDTIRELNPVMLSLVLFMEIRHIHTMGNRQIRVMNISTPYTRTVDAFFFLFILFPPSIFRPACVLPQTG